MFVPSKTYRITYDDSWFDSAEKQKLCAHEVSYDKSQELDFVPRSLIIVKRKETPKGDRCLIKELPTKDGNT